VGNKEDHKSLLNKNIKKNLLLYEKKRRHTLPTGRKKTPKRSMRLQEMGGRSAKKDWGKWFGGSDGIKL